MFTFSFGTAMAGTYSNTAEESALLSEALQYATATAKKIDYDGVPYTGQTLGDPSTYKIEAGTVQTGVNKAFDLANAGLNGTGFFAVLGVTLNTTDSRAVDVQRLKDALLAKADEKTIAEAAWEGYKSFLLSLVDKVDISMYTDTKDKNYTTLDGITGVTSAKEAAELDIAAAKKVINEASLASGTYAWQASDTIKSAFERLFDAVFKNSINSGKYILVEEEKNDLIHNSEVSGFSYSINTTAYETKADAATNAATLEVAKATKLAQLNQAITDYRYSKGIYSSLPAGDGYKAKYAESLEAFTKAVTLYINSAETIAELTTLNLTGGFATATASITYDSATGWYSITNPPLNFDFLKVNSLIAGAEKLAAGMKTEYNADGTKKYSDKKVDEGLRAIKMKLITSNTIPNAPGSTVFVAVPAGGIVEAHIAVESVFQTASQKAYFKIAVPTGNKTGAYSRTFPGFTNPICAETTYFDKEMELVRAAITKYNTAIDNATVDKDVKDALDTLKADLALTKIGDKATVQKTWAANGATLQTNVEKYIDAKRAAAGEAIYVPWDSTPTKYAAVSNTIPAYAFASTTPDKATTVNELGDWAFKKGARTEKEITALYAEACKVVDGYTTASALRAEATKVIEMIKALPATIALADKAAVEKAADALEALPIDIKPQVTNRNTLYDDIAKLEELEAYHVAGLAAKLPSLSKVTLADKEAIKAAKEAYNAYSTFVAPGTVHTEGLYTVTASGTALTQTYRTAPNFAALEKVIVDLERDAIIDAVKVLNTKKTLGQLSAEDLKAVEETQKMIENFIAENPDGSLRAQEIMLAAVAKDVKALAHNAAIKAVESVNLKVRSTVGKGYIKITWRFAKGDAEDVQYYEVYRSTKRNSGFKKVYTTKDATKMSYKNTKNLKKGKTYYYKVRAVKVVEGTAYASDWSNKAYRVAK